MKDPRECLDEVQALIDSSPADESPHDNSEISFYLSMIKDFLFYNHPDFKCFFPAIEPPKPCTGCGMLTDECECIPF